MDVAKFLRTHSTVTFERPRGLVSPGYAWRYAQRSGVAALRKHRADADNKARAQTRRSGQRPE